MAHSSSMPTREYFFTWSNLIVLSPPISHAIFFNPFHHDWENIHRGWELERERVDRYRRKDKSCLVSLYLPLNHACTSMWYDEVRYALELKRGDPQTCWTTVPWTYPEHILYVPESLEIVNRFMTEVRRSTTLLRSRVFVARWLRETTELGCTHLALIRDFHNTFRLGRNSTGQTFQRIHT